MTSDKYSRSKPTNLSNNNKKGKQNQNIPKTTDCKLEYPTCITCYDTLELHEIAQPPCKVRIQFCSYFPDLM